MSYPILGIHEFGRRLLESCDLDPVYVMLWEGKREGNLSGDDIYKWLLAYWCFYHSGKCSVITEADDYWGAMAIGVKDTKRGVERRHFRGQKAAEAIFVLRTELREPNKIIEWFGSGDYNWSAAEIQGWPLFGPWIAFKACDMAERVLGLPIDFSSCHLGIYSEPRKAAAYIAHGAFDAPIAYEELKTVVNQLVVDFQMYKVPPSYNRPVNIQEIETILCKWKAHIKGHYPVGKDTEEVWQHCQNYGNLAEKLAEYIADQEFEVSHV